MLTIRPEVAVIAGSDSSGIAGVQRDTLTIHAMGAHALNVITSNTAQDHEGVKAVYPVDENIFRHHLKLIAGRTPHAIKVGLLTSKVHVELLANTVKNTPHLRTIPLIFDPVLTATSGEVFTLDAIDQTSLHKAITHTLLPLCDLITPNIHEAEVLCGKKITSVMDMEMAAEQLLAMGAKRVYIKGGHFAEGTGELSQDYFCTNKTGFWLSSEKVSTENSRATGCAFASACAAALARGYAIEDAVVIAKMAINSGLRNAYGLEHQSGPVDILAFPNEQQDLPTLTRKHINQKYGLAFPPTTQPDGTQSPMGLYPVVDSYAWVERMIHAGVTTLQLRIKELSGSALRKEIQDSVTLAKQHNCRLFINDYWELAIETGAYGVHLGQEDLNDADLHAIHKAGLRLGLSTHCHYEVARAHYYQPSYIACGPVYHTNTKQMPWTPHGVQGLEYWLTTLHYPVVAIGGINAERIPAIAELQPDSIAMITAITLADDPEGVVQTFKKIIENAKK